MHLSLGLDLRKASERRIEGDLFNSRGTSKYASLFFTRFGRAWFLELAIESATDETEGLCDAVCDAGLTGAGLEDLVAVEGFGDVSFAQENAFPTCRYCKVPPFHSSSLLQDSLLRFQMLFSLIERSLDLDSLLDQAKTSITSICVMAGVGDEKDCKEAVEEAAKGVSGMWLISTVLTCALGLLPRCQICMRRC